MFKHVLVPTDGSTLSLSALETAMGLAAPLGAKLSVMTASPVYPPVYAGDGYVIEPMTNKEWKAVTAKHAKATEEAVLKKAAKVAQKLGKSVELQFVSRADNAPYQAIIDVAKKRKCDLIVMASHGRRGLSALLLGSETTKVLTHSKIPVLVCR